MRAVLRNGMMAAMAVLGLAGAAAGAKAATVADVLASDGRFTMFLTIVQRAGLTDSLRQPGQVTVFAPVGEAFQRTPIENLRPLSPQGGNENPNQFQPQLQSLVRIHILQNAYLPSALVGQRGTVTSTAGTPLIVDGTQSGVLTITTIPQNVGGPNIAGATTSRTAQVVGQPIQTDNGLIYPIDNVLIQ